MNVYMFYIFIWRIPYAKCAKYTTIAEEEYKWLLSENVFCKKESSKIPGLIFCMSEIYVHLFKTYGVQWNVIS